MVGKIDMMPYKLSPVSWCLFPCHPMGRSMAVVLSLHAHRLVR